MMKEFINCVKDRGVIAEFPIPDGTIQKQGEKVNPTQFYLYSELEKQTKQTSVLSVGQATTLLTNITHLDQEGMKMLFVLMKCYAVKHKDCDVLTIPYQPAVLRAHDHDLFDLEFDLKKIPPKLQNMMLLFTGKHLENMEIAQMRAGLTIVA